MSRRDAIDIVGLGAQTSLGRTALSSAAAVMAGITRQEEHPYMIDQYGEPMLVSMASYLSEDLGAIDRMVQLAAGATREALSPLSRLDIPPAAEIPIFLGLPSSRPGLPTDLGAQVSSKLRRELSDVIGLGHIRTYELGHSAGLKAIEEACSLLRSGAVPLALAGGSDSYMDPDTLEWLDENEQLHSEAHTWGFCPGEAAGLCLLANPHLVRDLSPAGHILAVASSFEKNPIKTDTVCVGEGLFQRAPLNGVRVSRVFCDLNGEPYRADEIGFTLVRFVDMLEDPSAFVTPAESWGDIGAASGPLFVNVSLSGPFLGYDQGTLFLLSTSSEGGERSAALIERNQR
jgi:3-oxoacyl-[acyl-carrier-protein] synthase-1